MSTTGDVVRARIVDVCEADPFAFVEAVSPFDFTVQPSGQIDGVYRVTMAGESTIGGFNLTEDRTDHVEVWLARKQTASPGDTYTQLLADAAALRAAVIRDGISWGEYSVPDHGAGVSIDHATGSEYAVLRVSLDVNYEATLA